MIPPRSPTLPSPPPAPARSPAHGQAVAFELPDGRWLRVVVPGAVAVTAASCDTPVLARCVLTDTTHRTLAQVKSFDALLERGREGLR